MFRSAIAAALLGAALAADAGRPHPHTGKLEPFRHGAPRPLSATATAKLAAGKAVFNSVRTGVGASANVSVTFDVDAPPDLVWAAVNDVAAYPRMVGGVAEAAVYHASPLGKGATLTLAKFRSSVLGHRVAYFLEHSFEPRQQSMVFRLDYSRLSDLDDSVGYWHVAAKTELDGRVTSRVTHAAAWALRGWWPRAVVHLMLKSWLRQATSWVATDSMARHASRTAMLAEARRRRRGGGGARPPPPPPQCRWSWKRVRRVCEAVPPAYRARDDDKKQSIQSIVTTVLVGVGLVGFKLWVQANRGRLGINKRDRVRRQRAEQARIIAEHEKFMAEEELRQAALRELQGGSE